MLTPNVSRLINCLLCSCSGPGVEFTPVVLLSGKFYLLDVFLYLFMLIANDAGAKKELDLVL